jgi:hypothetical protein
VTVKEKKITQWAPLAGRWDVSTTNPVYLGPQAVNQPYGLPYGICISDERFQGGDARATVYFPKTTDGGNLSDVSGGILFGFRSLTEEYVYAAVGGYSSAYVLARFTPNLFYGFARAGSHENLTAEHPYALSVHMSGQNMIFKVDDVTVLSSRLETAPLQGQLGLFAWSDKTRIEFRDASVTEEPGKVFVIMPFSKYYLEELYTDVIKPTVNEGNKLGAHHAGETLGPGIIIKDVEKNISESKIVIADITECNRNVYYEVGYAHAAKIPTILLVHEGTDLPFDVSGYRCIFYQNTISGKAKIIKRLQEFRTNCRMQRCDGTKDNAL